MLKDLHLIVFLIRECLPTLQPFSKSSDVPLLQSALVLPDPSVLVQDVDLLFDVGDLAPDETGDGRFGLADVDCPQEFQSFVEHSGSRAEEVPLLETCGTAEERVVLLEV